MVLVVSRRYEQEAVELLQQLIRNRCVNDGTGSASEVANADDLHSVINGCGADVEVFDAAPGRRSLMARLPGTDPSAPSLMLMAHTDVVPADEERWTFDPYAAEIHDGFVYGRGTLDMLGHAATMALAFRDHALSGTHQGGDLVFLAVADEEALSTHGFGWLDHHHPELLEVDWAVTESGGVVTPSPQGDAAGPPLISAMSAEKGALRVELIVQGTPGHGRTPYGGEGAIDTVAALVQRFRKGTSAVVITDEWKRAVRASFSHRLQAILIDPLLLEEALPQLPPLLARMAHASTRITTAVTTISTNGSWNTIASEAVIGLDVRVLPGQTVDDALALLQAMAADVGARVDIRVVATSLGSSSPPDGRFWDLLGRAAEAQVPGVRMKPVFNPGVSDARYLRAHGARTYGFGMYSPRMEPEWFATMPHGDDERVDVESIAATRRLWDSVLTLHTHERSS